MDSLSEIKTLFNVVSSEDESALKAFLSQNKNIDVNIKDDEGDTPLIWACLFGSYNIAQILIEHGADVNANGDAYHRWSPLSCASFQGQLSIVQLLLSLGANVNATDDYGDTALMSAAKEGHTEIVTVLLAAGANVNTKDKNDRTALHWAAVRGDYPDTTLALISAGAEVDLKQESSSGDTALISAASMGHFSTVSTLINAGADVNSRNNADETALMKAVEIGHFNIISILVDAGANVSIEAQNGKTALSIAEEKASLYYKIVSVLQAKQVL
jgi:uncharacterized protein